MVSRLWCITNSQVKLGSTVTRKIKMVIEGKNQALAKSFPPWTLAIWYWNVFMGSRIFQKNKPEILFPLRNCGKLVKDFHPVIIGKNITGKKHTVHANISPINWECHFSKTQQRWSCSAEDKGVILWFWLGKSYSVIFTRNIAQDVQSEQGFRRRGENLRYLPRTNVLSSEHQEWLKLFSWISRIKP